jgi:hypothetical protein
MSYWPGMTAAACNSASHNLMATSVITTQTNSNLNLASRNAPVYESCYWQIQAQPDTFRDTAMINIWVTSLSKANLYIYSGPDRHNATAVIELNQTTAIGAPYKVSVTAGAIVVLQVQSG